MSQLDTGSTFIHYQTRIVLGSSLEYPIVSSLLDTVKDLNNGIYFNMNDTDIKQIIIDTLTEQNAWRDLAPAVVAGLAIDMALAVVRKE